MELNFMMAYLNGLDFPELETVIDDCFPSSNFEFTFGGPAPITCYIRKAKSIFRRDKMEIYIWGNAHDGFPAYWMDALQEVNRVGKAPKELQKSLFQSLMKCDLFFQATGKVASFEKELKQVMKKLGGIYDLNQQGWYDAQNRLILNRQGKTQVPDYRDEKPAIFSFNGKLEEIYASQLMRKLRTEDLLDKFDIPSISHLPFVDPDEMANCKTPDQIAKRAIGLNWYCAALLGGDVDGVMKEIAEQNLKPYLSGSEWSKLQSRNITEHDRINASWRMEALAVLLWALGLIPDFAFPDEMTPPDRLVDWIGYKADLGSYLQKAKPKTNSELLDMLDLRYRVHWATRNARLNGEPEPAGLSESIAEERHYAIEWICNQEFDSWDEVETHT